MFFMTELQMITCYNYYFFHFAVFMLKDLEVLRPAVKLSRNSRLNVVICNAFKFICKYVNL